MIYVLNKVDSIANILEPQKEKSYWGDLHIQDLKEGIETFEFSTDVDIPTNSTIVLRTSRNELVPFIVQRVNKISNYSRTIHYTCDAEFLELRYSKILEPQLLEGQTPETALSFGLQGTRWQLGDVEVADVKEVHIDEYMNVLKYLRVIAAEFDLELRFRVEFLNSRVSRRYVDFVKKTGLDAGKEIVFGKDLQNIERLEDSSAIVSALYGVGPADDNGNFMTVASVNGGKPYVENKGALDRWGKDGEHRYDIFMPSVDKEGLTPQELLRLTNEELSKRINSIVTYKVDGVDFYDVLGMDHEVVNLGDTVRIKDEGFSPPLYLEARIIRVERSYTDSSRNQYTLGDYVEVDIKTYKYIRDLQKLINKSKESWNAAEENAVQRAQLIIEQTEESINVRVEGVKQTVDGHTTTINQINLDIDGIVLKANQTDTRLGEAEASILVNANGIQQRVSKDDYNGNVIASLINQTATDITIQAEKINLNGITRVASQLNIGEQFDNSSYKSLYFRGGDAVIEVAPYSSGLLLFTITDVNLNNCLKAVNGSGTEFTKPVTSSAPEQGYCGVGGMDSMGTSGAVAGVGVNFKATRKYTPSSVNISSFSGGTNAGFVTTSQITRDGFWLFIGGSGTADVFKYWRGTYSVS
ncbi:phage tail spike protein [Cytobacillus sp.]|uniref:phage tail spike protein n=1 Tax=Cytobacillus sp. TaxID=2675269 RepID=UPI003515D70E